jgi:GTP-binding protein HflX
LASCRTNSEAFRSTLEEVTLASLILHVADASSALLEGQVAAVREVLGDIGAGGIEELLALNKADLLGPVERERLGIRFPEAVLVSGRTGEGLEELIQRAEAGLPRFPIEVTLLVAFGREDLVARLYRDAEVLSKEIDDSGTLVHARVGERLYREVREMVIASEEPP